MAIKKALISILIFVLIFWAAVPAYPSVLSLDPLIEEALKNNPEILAEAKRYEAAKARIPQAKSLDDPVLEFKFEKTPGSPFQLQKTPSEDRMLSLAQFLPLFGKLSLKGKIALVESQMLASRYKDIELDVINRVKNVYYDLFMSHKEIELNRENLTLLENTAKVAEARYAVGDLDQEDVLKIYSEIAMLSNDIKNLEQERSARQTRLNTLLNRDPEAALGIPELSQDTTAIKDIRSLYQDVILNRPELIIFSYAIERNKYAKSLAKRSFLPDLMAKITERGFTTGTIGPWDLMLAFTVPLWFWTKQRYAVKEAIANVEEAEAAYKAMQNKAFSEVKGLVSKVEIARNKIRLNKTSLIPILESSIESSLAAFSSGKGDFMMLLDTERMLVAVKMDYYRALVEYNMNLADLERTVGMNLNKEVQRGK